MISLQCHQVPALLKLTCLSAASDILENAGISAVSFSDTCPYNLKHMTTAQAQPQQSINFQLLHIFKDRFMKLYYQSSNQLQSTSQLNSNIVSDSDSAWSQHFYGRLLSPHQWHTDVAILSICLSVTFQYSIEMI